MPSKALILVMALLSFLQVQAQIDRPGGKSILYKNERNLGLMLHTHGKGLSVQFARHLKGDNYSLLDFNLYQLRHPKEYRRPDFQSRPYVFGKANAAFVLKANFGRRFILADRHHRNNIRINFNVGAGPALGILKPVYLKIRIPTPDGEKQRYTPQKFDPEDPDQHEKIAGGSSPLLGIKELQFMAGGNAKASFSFEWGSYDYKYYSLETGVMLDAFPKDVAIFAYPENKRLFINIFLALSYGTRR
ncbi:MAG: hypothetical protein M3Q97_09845 [Bacteroidota bacterium]|nr:hypothetical protein [Bacteroidota bacterium]